MIPNRQFQIACITRTADGTNPCSERLSITPATYDEKFTFAKVRAAFLEKQSKGMLLNMMVTGIIEVDGDGNTLKVLTG